MVQSARRSLTYAILLTLLCVVLWYKIKPNIPAIWNYSFNSIKGSDYHIPDFDGTNASCRCGKGPQVYYWPPLVVSEDLLCGNSTYDLTLCVLLDSSKPQATTKLDQRLNWLENSNLKSEKKAIDRGEESALLRWFRLEGQQQNNGEDGYDMYPLAINLTDTIEAIRNGRPAPHAPITNPNIKLLRTSRTACAPEDVGPEKESYDVVVVYRTAVYHFEERERIRNVTHDLPAEIKVVFSVGQPRKDGGGNFFHMNGGFDLRLPERAGVVAKRWAQRAAEAQWRLFAEADLHGDLIIGDYIDTYVNLTYKLIASHRWASAFCNGKSDVFLFLDDDYEFNAKNLLQYLSGLDRSMRRQLLSGPLMTWRRVIRPYKDANRNKWAMTLDEVPWSRLPPYVWGTASLIGADVLNDLVVGEAYTRFLWVDDAFLGFVVAKLPGRKFQNMKGFYLESNNNEKALVSHIPFQFSIQWFVDNVRQFLYNLNL